MFSPIMFVASVIIHSYNLFAKISSN